MSEGSVADLRSKDPQRATIQKALLRREMDRDGIERLALALTELLPGTQLQHILDRHPYCSSVGDACHRQTGVYRDPEPELTHARRTFWLM